MPTKNVNLSKQEALFVRRSVDHGGFRNASEVVRAGLRLLEHQQKMNAIKLRTLRKLSKRSFDDIDRGEHVVVDPSGLDQFMAELTSQQAGTGRR